MIAAEIAAAMDTIAAAAAEAAPEFTDDNLRAISRALGAVDSDEENSA